MSEDLFELPKLEDRCNLQQVWSTVRHSHITCIDARQEELIKNLQDRYGWTREEAVCELNRRLGIYARIRIG